MESDHDLTITGNLFVEGGGTPVVRTLGPYQINVNYTVPVQAQVVNVSGGVGTVAEVQDAVWSATDFGTHGSSSAGYKLNAAGAAGDPWTADLSTYADGTAGHYIRNKILSVAKFLGLK